MARPKKAGEQLSAQELYELARQREEEEREAEKGAVRAQIDELRVRRKSLVAEQKRALAAIDKEIAALQRQVKPGRGARSNGGAQGSLSNAVLKLLEGSRGTATGELKAALDEKGFDTTNLGQTLAYLKRNGRIESPSRATYKLA